MHVHLYLQSVETERNKKHAKYLRTLIKKLDQKSDCEQRFTKSWFSTIFVAESLYMGYVWLLLRDSAPAGVNVLKAAGWPPLHQGLHYYSSAH